jgi:hypothetical protein
MAFTCGAIVGGDDNDALLELLTVAIVAPVAPRVAHTELYRHHIYIYK